MSGILFQLVRSGGLGVSLNKLDIMQFYDFEPVKNRRMCIIPLLAIFRTTLIYS